MAGHAHHGMSMALIRVLGQVSVPVIGFSYRPGLDPLTLALIVIVLTAVGAAAACVPARRAATLDPLTALRHD